MARSETRLGETTPRLINPPSVEADEADERSERRQRDNAHSTTGRTHKSSYTLGCWALVIRTHCIHRETRSAPENRVADRSRERARARETAIAATNYNTTIHN